MQFLVLGYDGTDAEAPARRQAARPAHFDLSRKMQAAGQGLTGAAILNEAGEMIGSMMVMDLPDRAALDAWLAEEPYVTQNVWQRIEVLPCRVAPHFLPG